MATRVLKPRLEREDEAPATGGARPGPGFVAKVIILAAVAAAALAVWRASDVLLMAFGGLLLAVTLSALADLLARRTPLGRRFALPVAVLAILVALGLVAWAVGGTLAGQFNELLQQLPAALAKLRDWLAAAGVGRTVLDSFGSVDSTESALKLLGAAMSTLGAAANVLLVLVLGIYLAADPGLYRRGFLRLVPSRHRSQAAAALDEASAALRKWLGGQLVAMAVVGVLTGIGLLALDVPLAFSLATIAALLEFIPFIGPIVAAIPAVLIAFSRDPATALYVALLYFAIQQLEGYLLTPLVQRWAVALPPALGALSVVVFGVLFGVPGVLFAVPLTVVAIVLVRELVLEREPAR
jgi:predicted PurR-regulated permease PerM